MKIKTSDLIGAALDYAVGQANKHKLEWACDEFNNWFCFIPGNVDYKPSTNWAQGGEIMDAATIDPMQTEDGWFARHTVGNKIFVAGGPTLLVAAMRCYVASMLGEEVEVPEELGPKPRRIKFICARCSSDLVRRDAWAEWDTENQEWTLDSVFDYAHCGDCDGGTKIEEVEIP